MTRLLEALVKGSSALPEVAEALGELRGKLRRVRELEGEIGELLRKVGLLDGDPFACPGSRRPELREEERETLRKLGMPDFPRGPFRRTLEGEAELALREGMRKVRLCWLSATLDPELPEGVELEISYELDGRHFSRVEIEGVLDLPVLRTLSPHVRVLLWLATERLWEYECELREFKRRVLSEYPRWILLRDL
jgi:hypothetical protein